MHATPVFGIRTPDPTTKMRELGSELSQMGDDVDAAMARAQIAPTAYETGTRAERLAAAPLRRLLWVETDQNGARWIGTGDAWLQLDAGFVARRNLASTALTNFQSGFSGLNAAGWSAPRIRVVDDVAFVWGAVQRATAPAAEAVVLLLPNGYAPQHKIRGVNCDLTTAGELITQSGWATTMAFSVTWPLAPTS